MLAMDWVAWYFAAWAMRCKQAIRLGAVILSSAVNNDGDRKVGYTAPFAAGQQAVIEEALALAALDHRQIGFIETHGTGTPLGDAIEIDALRKVFTPRHEDQRCALGSVKSNMGHLDTAAGIAGLLKTVLTVSHGQIPPTLHFQTPHPALKLEETPFTVPVAPQAWRDDIRYAGVSSFGIGGTNCHMIVASLPDTLRATAPCCKDPVATPALLLSAASENALRKQAECYATALKEGVAANNLAFTALHARRLDLPFRLAIPLNNQTTAALSAWASDQPGPPAYSGHGAPGKQVWLFTGQGRIGTPWAERCISIQRPSRSAWIAASLPAPPPLPRRYRRPCSMPIPHYWKIWHGRSLQSSRSACQWPPTGALKGWSQTLPSAIRSASLPPPWCAAITPLSRLCRWSVSVAHSCNSVATAAWWQYLPKRPCCYQLPMNVG